jgi:hypothetical protein
MKRNKTLNVTSHPTVALKFKDYPKEVKPKLNYLRGLILETASEISSIVELEETLKWGEPSYLVKRGSTIRIDWKEKSPNQYAMYFKCTSKLVTTFKEVYGDIFNYETTRAIVFRLDDKVPTKELKECIELALTYHLVKNLTRLGKSNY